MITARDKLIIKHIEKYGFITIRQARELFFARNSSQAYEMARRRLRAIKESGITFDNKDRILTTAPNKVTSEYVYYYKKNPPTYHDIQIMNVYSSLVFIGIEVDLFKKHAEWLGGKYISDAFIGYKVGDVSHTAFIEVCYTNNDTHIRGYEEFHETNILQAKLQGVFPKIILVGHTGKIQETFLKVVSVQEDLSDLYLVLH